MASDACHHLCPRNWAIIVAATATFVATGSSFVLIFQHLKLNKLSSLRRLTIRIILMVPIYSIEAFTALVVQVRGRVSVESLQFFREFYEAIVILSFLQYILVCVGGHQAAMHRVPPSSQPAACNESSSEEARDAAPTTADGEAESSSAYNERDKDAQNTATATTSDGEEVRKTATTVNGDASHKLHHLWPLSKCFRPWTNVRGMTKWCIRGALLYVVVGVLSTLIGVTEFLYNLGTNDLMGNPSVLFDISNWAISIAQTFAIMALAELAHNLMHQLTGLRPLGKFLSVKLIVFFTFWQGLVIDWLCKDTTFFDRPGSTPEEVAAAYKNFLLCVEMAFFAVAHFFVFPPTDYEIVLASRGVFLPASGKIRKFSWRDILGIAFNLRDAVNFKDMCSVAWDVGIPKQPKGFARKGASAQAPSLGESANTV